MKKHKLLIIFFILFLFSMNLEAEDNPPKKVNSPYLGIAIEGTNVSEKILQDYEEEVGFRINFVNMFIQWPENVFYGNFPLNSLYSIWEYGAVPIITWEPIYIKNGMETAINYEDIISEKYDKYLSNIVDQVKKYNKPLIIRFAHEMNLSRYHWGTAKENYGMKSPSIYKQMFSYIVSFFNSRKVDNVLWAFCPNSDSVPYALWNKIRNYYPGDEYVDILGLDGYNWGDTKIDNWQSKYRTFEEIFAKAYGELKDLHSKKPIFIFETATVEKGGDKSRWISDAIKIAQNWNIKGLIWFQIDKEKKWKITKKDKKIFQQFDQLPFPQTWAEGILNEKRYTVKASRRSD